MKAILKTRINHIALNYYIYCISLYILIAIGWEKYAQWLSYDNAGSVVRFNGLYMGVLIMMLAATLKQWKPKLHAFSWLVLLVGLLLEVNFIFTHYNSIFSNYAIGMVVFVSVVVSCWALIAFINGVNINVNKLLGRKMAKYYFVITLIFYFAVLEVGKYYANSIKRIASSGSLFVDGGLSYNQMATMINDKVNEAYLALSLVTILMMSIFFVIYKRILGKLEDSDYADAT